MCTSNSSKASRFICPDASLVLVVGVVDNACKLFIPAIHNLRFRALVMYGFVNAYAASCVAEVWQQQCI